MMPKDMPQSLRDRVFGDGNGGAAFDDFGQYDEDNKPSESDFHAAILESVEADEFMFEEPGDDASDEEWESWQERAEAFNERKQEIIDSMDAEIPELYVEWLGQFEAHLADMLRWDLDVELPTEAGQSQPARL